MYVAREQLKGFRNEFIYYTHWHMSTAVCKWQHLAIAIYITKKNIFIYKQMSQNRQFFSWKPTDMALVMCQ
jgi:hypothetical protein